MNIKNRLTKIEQTITSQRENKAAEDTETQCCEHPLSMFLLYRDYPPKGSLDRRLVVKGHCNGCGFDDYLWSFYNLTEAQETQRQELIDASDFFESMAYDLSLINAGLVGLTLFPPSPEIQARFTGKADIL